MENRPEPQPVKALLRQRNVRYRDVAEAAGISPAWVSHLVNGYREPKPELRRAFAAYLDVPEGDLFRAEGEEAADDPT